LNAANPVTLSAESVNEVRYRATDGSGNVSQIGTVTARIDKTAPTLSVSGVENRTYGDSASVKPVFSASDVTSGVASVTATIGDDQIISDKPITLWQLGLGKHELIVTGKDKAGHLTERTVEFEITTSFADVGALIDYFGKAGSVTSRGATVLRSRLDQAVKQADKGKKKDAIKELEQFVKLARESRNVTDSAVRDVLVRDAQALIVRLRA
jgi:uncharacterized protein YifE (UPF0438 family)